MTNEIMIALIGLAGSAIGSLGGVVISGKLTQYRIEQLERKVEQHNSLIERTYALEETCAIHEEKIKAVGRRVDILEHSHA